MDKVFMPHRGMRYLLPCLLGLALLAPATAWAIDFKISGVWQILLEESNVTPRGVDGADSFGALQRFRIQLDAVASEDLSGSVQFELGRTEWGQSATGGALGADGTVAEVRHAYLDWQLPQTDIKVRMGLQPLMLPGIVSGFSATWCHDMAGISLGAPLYDSQDLEAELALFWARPYNDNSEATFGPDKATRHLDNMDVFALSLPVRGERFKINPWAMYAMIGQYSLSGLSVSTEPAIVAPRGGLMPVLGDGGTYSGFQSAWLSGLDRAWGGGIWLGMTAEFLLTDDLKLSMEGTYGAVDLGEVSNYTGFGETGRTFEVRRAGWYAAARLDYTFDWGIPGILGWYASGDDDNPYNGAERLPQYNTPWMVSTLGFGGSHIDEATWKVLGSNPGGMAAVVFQIRELSFVEDLRYRLAVACYWGTNSPQMPARAHMRWPTRADGPHAYLTTTDNAWEVDLTSEYKLYENFTINVEAAYVRLNLDSDTWNGAEKAPFRDNYRVSALFTYTF